MKTCSKCGVSKPLDAFNRRSALSDGRNSYCRACANEKADTFYASTRDRQAGYRIKRKYKMTDAEFDYWNANNRGPCEMCGKPETINTSLNTGQCRLSVDHDHVTGRYRGLLCYWCNTTRFPDDIEMLKTRIAYLERHSANPPTSAWMVW